VNNAVKVGLSIGRYRFFMPKTGMCPQTTVMNVLLILFKRAEATTFAPLLPLTTRLLQQNKIKL
jgi:hypothetical protein